MAKRQHKIPSCKGNHFMFVIEESWTSWIPTFQQHRKTIEPSSQLNWKSTPRKMLQPTGSVKTIQKPGDMA